MINLIILAIFFIALLFIFSTVVTETLVLLALKWGNLWQSLSATIVMNAVSFIFLICGILGIGSISIGSFGVSSPQSENQISTAFSVTWYIQMFVMLVLIEGVILFFLSMTKLFGKFPDEKAMDDVQPIWWKKLLRTMFLSFCANAASFAVFSACKASSAFW